MHKCTYFPDDTRTKEILRRAELLQKSYGCSFSALVLKGLEMLVKVRKPSRKAPDFRTPSIVKVKGKNEH